MCSPCRTGSLYGKQLPASLRKTGFFHFVRQFACHYGERNRAALDFLLHGGMVLARYKTKMSSFIFLLYAAATLIPFQCVMLPLIRFMDG